ncbi:hypothetical protein FRC96_20940 [Lujinxingia vulgaris]|uniref:Uncharacterized protein n=1 Tax=Lujinxingia vulgaris TaxID=2600176 RepID=A0A5C6WT84_9DELT|nr:lysyl oxidase family protein [Lujinxingia vulgaris]TXD31631.1 hypothetical protein FRC96_20940 [Lujinxingia vulgaris]
MNHASNRVRLWCSALLLALSVLHLSACTSGSVEDALTSSPVPGAELRLYAWPPPESTGYSWEWPRDLRREQPDHFARSAQARLNGANFGLGGAGPCLVDPESTLSPGQWYRVRIDHPDYRPGIFYRFHDGYNEQCTFDLCTSQAVESAGGPCRREDFALWPREGDYQLLPDIIVDVREFEDNLWQCAIMPSGPPLFGLRVGASTANVGTGPLHLEGRGFGLEDDPEQAQVVQKIDRHQGGQDELDLGQDAFELHPGHNHIHFKDWLALELIQPTAECDTPGPRPEGCSLAQGTKLSFCIMDLEPFDAEIRQHYAGFQRYPEPPTCDSVEQGLSPGWKDVYHALLEGQVVIVGDADAMDALPAQVIVEASVDPQGKLTELNTTNNRASKVLARPLDLPALCDSPLSRIDCSGPESSFDDEEQEMCPDYLRFIDNLAVRRP